MHAITPKGVGNEVGARSIREAWPLREGETFTADWQPGMVLAEDELSLRWPTDDEQAETDTTEWHERIATERERRLNTSIPVALSDGEYVVPVTDRAASQAPEAARRARADTEDKTRPFPTDKGIVERSPDDLDAIGDALDTYMKRVWRRARDLQAMAADGSVTQEDIETGWP